MKLYSYLMRTDILKPFGMVLIVLLVGCSGGNTAVKAQEPNEAQMAMAGVARLLLENDGNAQTKYYQYYKRDYASIVELYHEAFVDNDIFTGKSGQSLFLDLNPIELRQVRQASSDKLTQTEQEIRKAQMTDLTLTSRFIFYMGDFDADALAFKNSDGFYASPEISFAIPKATVFFGDLFLKIKLTKEILLKDLKISEEHAQRLYDDSEAELHLTYDLVYQDNEPKAVPQKLEIRFPGTSTVIATVTQF